MLPQRLSFEPHKFYTCRKCSSNSFSSRRLTVTPLVPLDSLLTSFQQTWDNSAWQCVCSCLYGVVQNHKHCTVTIYFVRRLWDTRTSGVAGIPLSTWMRRHNKSYNFWPFFTKAMLKAQYRASKVAIAANKLSSSILSSSRQTAKDFVSKSGPSNVIVGR